jgi:hypothetical protein
MHRKEVDRLDPRQPHWAAAVEAPTRDWVAAPGCRAHARFLVDGVRLAPSRMEFEHFDSRAECLQWIMAHRHALNDRMPGATVRPVKLASWLLGLA